MANIKPIRLIWSVTSLTCYAIIEQEATLYMLDDGDGTFAAAPGDPYVALTEHSVVKGRYGKDESREAWDDGWYQVMIYRQNGASPSPANDTIIGGGRFYVKDDLETTYRDIADQTDQLVFDVDSNVHSTRTYKTGAVVTNAANSPSAFQTDLTETSDDYWVGSYLKLTSGVLSGQVKKVYTYNGSTGVITLMAPFTATPADGVTFKMINE